MKVLLVIEADVEPENIALYRGRYPNFDGETVGVVLFREATAAWESEGLMTLANAARLVYAVVARS